MAIAFYDLDAPGASINVRWIQPPQAAYFVTTVDRHGNTNVTPVTMGTCVAVASNEFYFAFSFSNHLVPDWDEGDDKPNVKHGYYNLKENPQCVISYIGYDLLRQSWIAGLPIPRGISEMEVAGLTPLPSRKVKPSGIRECPINIEAKVISAQKLGSRWMFYVCQVVGVSIDTGYERGGASVMGDLGVMAIDPLFEVLIGKGGTGRVRLYYDRLDPTKIERTPEDLGCDDMWIGTFEMWLDDEQKRGKLDEEDKQAILALNRAWQANRDPQANASVKAELTERLKRLVQRPADVG